MPRIRVDDIEVPAEERTLSSCLEVLRPDCEIEITLRESEWVPRTVEHVHIFLHEHSAEAVGVDIFIDWAKDRLKRAPENTEKLVIYGPDRKPLKTITVKKDSIEE